MGSHGVASARLRAGKTRQHAGDPAAAQLKGPRGRTLRDWPVFWRLVAVIVLALIMGLVFGGLRVASALGHPILRQGGPHVARLAAFAAGIGLPLALGRVIGP